MDLPLWPRHAWTQPRTPTRINRQNKYGPDIIFAAVYNEDAGAAPFDITDPPATATLHGTAAYTTGPNYKGISVVSAANHIDWGNPAKLAFTETSSFTIVQLIQHTTVGESFPQLFSNDSGLGGRILFQFRLNSDKLETLIGTTAATLGSVTGATAMTAGTLHLVGYRRDRANTEHAVFLDGKKNATNTDASNSTFTLGSGLWATELTGAGSNGYTGKILLTLVFSRALSDAEMLDLYNDPWQWVENGLNQESLLSVARVPTQTYVVVASGGMTVSGTAPFTAKMGQIGGGGVAISGTGNANRDFRVTGSGGVVIGGTAPTTVNFNTVRTGIVVGSYVGDGTGARSLSGVSPAAGISVWVMGIDGSNKEIGALRIAGMSAGKSHPWKPQPTTADSARDNRITSIDATGFTVGTDLNVNGLVYTYIIWPYLAGVTAAGSWNGDGTVLPARIVAGNLGISGVNASATSAFDASDVGRILWDLDNNVAIGTIVTVSNSSNVIITGGVDGTYISAHWSIGKKSVASIGFVPDLVVVVADQTLPEAATAEITPLQISPGIISQKLGLAGLNQNFADTGVNPAFLAVYSGTSDIVQVANGAVATYNDSGVTFRWFAIKTTVGDAIFDKIDYTGNGAGSRTLSGLAFHPEFAILTGKSTAAGWKPESTAALATAKSSVFNDGGAEETSNIAFTNDGATFGSSNSFNTNAILYRAYFLKPRTTTTGGLTLGGAADCKKIFVVIAMTGSGGLTASGAAPFVANFKPTTSGGLTLGGAATVDVIRTRTASGGMTLGGAATVDVLYSPTISGGLTLGGAADIIATFIVEPDGGLTLGGAADLVANFVVTPDGGLTLGGDGNASFHRLFIYVGSGGLTLGGQAEVLTDVAHTYVVEPDGGLTLGGAASCSTLHTITPDGGLRISGTATVVNIRIVPGSTKIIYVYATCVCTELVLGGSAICKFIPGGVPVPSVKPGAVGGFIPTRQPFWAAPGTRVRAEIIQPAALVTASGRAIEDDLRNEENQLLGLL
jgi:hypothetical protein